MKTSPLNAISFAVLIAATCGGVAQAQSGDWSGPYVAGAFGYSPTIDSEDETVEFDTNLDGTFGETVRPANNAFAPGFCDGAALGATPAAGCDEDSDGVDVSVKAGYDMQFGNFVLGVLGEVSTNSVEDSVSAFSTTPTFYTLTRETDLVLAARVRAGYVFGQDGQNLVYGTGGIAGANIRRQFFTGNTANTFTFNEGEEGLQTGYQLGVGYERVIQNGWTFGAEYLLTSIKDDEYSVRAGPPTAATNPFILANPAGTDMRRSEDEFRFHAVRFSVGYRF
ncbi:MAG TPA: outer membrane beta-barrel protein [Caulobacteraceae bacterium]|jgi:opacity protein-like surface antigen